MKIFLTLIILIQFHIQAATTKTPLLFKQNEDGSCGHDKKVTMTSLAMSVYLSMGEDFKSVRYGKNIEKGIDWLIKKTEDLVKEDSKVSLDHLYTLWALSDVYIITESSKIPQSCLLLRDKIFSEYKNGVWNLKQRWNANYLMSMSKALNSLKYTGLCKNYSASMFSLYAASIKKCEVDFNSCLFWRFHSRVWQIPKERMGIVQCPAEYKDLCDGVGHSKYKVRKDSMAQTKKLPFRKRFILIECLKRSDNLESFLSAFELEMSYDFEKEKIPDSFGEDIKSLYFFTASFFIERYQEDLRIWLKLRKSVEKVQRPVLLDKKQDSTPEKQQKRENKLAWSALLHSIFYHHLNKTWRTTNRIRQRRKKDPTKEEGLDLVD